MRFVVPPAPVGAVGLVDPTPERRSAVSEQEAEQGGCAQHGSSAAAVWSRRSPGRCACAAHAQRARRLGPRKATVVRRRFGFLAFTHAFLHSPTLSRSAMALDELPSM
eukprot:1937497-Prymnesium_polylepis.1